MKNEKQNEVRKVALLIETSREYARGLLRGIAAWNHEHGPWTFQFQPLGLTQLPSDCLNSWNGDGLLVRIDHKEMEDAVLSCGKPAIDLRGALARPEIPFIGVDNRRIAEKGFLHLRETGVENFAFCGTVRNVNRFDDERRDFFRKFVEDAGYPCFDFPAEKISRRGNRIENELAAIAKWIQTLPVPTGLMACKDDQGIQVIDAARLVGRRIPDELAVLSVDNDPYFCDLSSPPMSSMETHSERIGYRAADMLQRLMNGQKNLPRFTLCPPGDVVKRRSSDVLAIQNRDDAKILRFLREQAIAGLSVNEVIENFDISRSTIERLVKKYFNRTPKEEMLRIQIEEAGNLLRRTDLSLARIAVQSGFRSVSYFIATFSRISGISPLKYRKMNDELSKSFDENLN